MQSDERDAQKAKAETQIQTSKERQRSKRVVSIQASEIFGKDQIHMSKDRCQRVISFNVDAFGPDFGTTIECSKRGA